MTSRVLRGIRGASSVETNDAASILEATERLLGELIRANDVAPCDIASIFFTATRDLNAAFPAAAARNMGLAGVPLLCAVEIDVPASLPRIVRVLLHVATDRSQDEIVHVYLGRARALRPDLCGGVSSDAGG